MFYIRCRNVESRISLQSDKIAAQIDFMFYKCDLYILFCSLDIKNFTLYSVTKL